MKNKSKSMLFMIIAIVSISATITHGYRRGGLFGGGGVLGTGVGSSRRGDYYSPEPGLLSRTGNVVSDVADDVADAVTGDPGYYRGRGYRRGYRRGGFRRGYGRHGYYN